MTPAQAEHTRLLTAARAKATKLRSRGRALDAVRWQAFAEWLRRNPPPQ